METILIARIEVRGYYQGGSACELRDLRAIKVFAPNEEFLYPEIFEMDVVHFLMWEKLHAMFEKFFEIIESICHVDVISVFLLDCNNHVIFILTGYRNDSKQIVMEPEELED